MKHAELPWIAFEDGQIQSINSKVVIWSSGLAKRSKNANAAFIVKACNNHEKLLEALEKIVSQTNDIRPPFRCIGPAQMVEIAREAIKAAEE